YDKIKTVINYECGNKMYLILFIILVYLLGTISSALVILKLTQQIYIREYVSGYMHDSNEHRILCFNVGIIFSLFVILNRTLATLITLFAAMYIDIDVSRLLIGLFAVLGHTFPIFARFKGGKAAATSAGVILGVSPLMFVIILLLFIII